MQPSLEKPPLVAMDVDGTLLEFSLKKIDPSFPREPLPGAVETIQWHATQGHEVHIWTAGGKDHAERTVELLGCEEYIADCHAKPNHPIIRDETIEILGRLPFITYDDSPSEAIIDNIYMPAVGKKVWTPVCPLVLRGDHYGDWAIARYYLIKAHILGSQAVHQSMSTLLSNIDPERAEKLIENYPTPTH